MRNHAPLLSALFLFAIPATAQTPYTGYTPAGTTAEQRMEQRLFALVDTATVRGFSRWLSSQAHVAGTPRQRVTALWADSLGRAWGLTARIDSFPIYMPHPLRLSLERLDPSPHQLAIGEPPIPDDPDSDNPFPPFNGYSWRGTVTGDVVYVNYGLIEDYDALERAGVSVQGKIAVARYGRSFRGIKAREAERHGAVGLIIYSDPQDDGYVSGDVYPTGPMRPPQAAQRGSILNDDGDPATPGWASTFGGRRLPEDSMNIPRIPVLPVGYGTASHLLEDLRGHDLPAQSWQGGLPFRYHVGPGPVRARLTVETEQGAAATHTIYNTVAMIRGTTWPDEWVVIGGHRDAWGPGAVDNVSGSADVLEIARVFGAMARAGMRPKRTVLFATWDAEEWGLQGSTEYVERDAERLNARVVGYVNLDVTATGPDFGASAAGSLKELIREVAATTPSPFDDGTLLALWQGQDSIPADSAPHVGDLGGGSDYAGFYDHLGIPSLDLGFSGPYGVYHSAYDTYHWMTSFGDPHYLEHAGAARMAGALVARLANADIAPYDHIGLASQLTRLTDTVIDSLATLGIPVNVDTLRGALAHLTRSARAFHDARAAALAGGRRLDLPRINRVLLTVDKALTRPSGLVGRPWFRNILFAADVDNGYANVFLPTVAEAIRAHDNARAAAEIDDFAGRLHEAASRLDQAAALLAR